MKILSFAEGANPSAGGMGLAGLPRLCRALTEQGENQVLLNLGGRTIPGSEQYVRSSAEEVLRPDGGAKSFGILTHAAYGKWAFAPSMLRRVWSVAKDTDFIMLHSLYNFPVLAGYLVARWHNKPYGFWPFGVLAPPQRAVSPRKKALYDRVVARRIIEGASVILYSAAGERAEAGPLALAAPSVIIPHGIDVAEYSRLPARGQFRGKYLDGFEGPLVIYLGRLNAKKGLDVLIESMAHVVKTMPDVRLAIIGSGDPTSFLKQVKAWVSEHGMGAQTVITGLVGNEDKLAALADADLFVLPSEAENFGHAMFEAMSSSVPVVISDTLNYAREVKQNEAGIVVPRNPNDVAEAIIKLICNPALRLRIGQNGYQMAQSYSWEACGQGIERTIRCILDHQPLPLELTLNERRKFN